MARTKFIPLKDAPWTFASKRLQSARYAAQEASRRSSKSQLTELEARKKQALENPAEMSKYVTYLFNGMVEAWKDWSAPELAMAESLLQKLQGGKLEAFGVQSAPKQKRQLEMIPEHFFVDAKISWNGNKVTNFGVTYSAARVRSAAAGKPREKASSIFVNAPVTPVAKPVPGDMPKRKPGPQSAAKEVIAAYDLMLQKGDIKQGMTIKAIYQKLLPVLERNSNQFPNGRGLTYPSIARHLRPHLTRSLKFSS